MTLSPLAKVVLEESDLSAAAIPEGCEELGLGNRAGVAVDPDELVRQLAALPGAGRILRLVIRPDSRLEDARVSAAFPALQELRVFGSKVRTLDGLGRFAGRVLQIDTGKNLRRDIAAIGDTQVERLVLRHGNPGDLAAIAGCRQLGELLLSSCPPLSLETWRNVPLRDLQLWGGTIDVLRDTRHLPGLRTLTVDDCRNLRAFAGENAPVSWMVIQVCNRLDLSTIRSFRGLAHLTIRGAKDDVPLSIVDGLPELQTLKLLGCRVRADLTDLRRSAPKLQELVAEKLTKDQVAGIGGANAGLSVKSTAWSFDDGVLAKRAMPAF